MKEARDGAAVQIEEHIRALWEAYYPLARAGDTSAAHICVRLLERQAKLYGLDEPVRTEDVKGGQVLIRAYPPGWVEALETECEREPEPAA